MEASTSAHRSLVDNLENIRQREAASVRTQIRHLVGGKIKLIPSGDREYLEAELNVYYEGLVRMAAGGSKRSVVGRAGIGHYLTIRIPLK